MSDALSSWIQTRLGGVTVGSKSVAAEPLPLMVRRLGR